jgi:hypothetical protein
MREEFEWDFDSQFVQRGSKGLKGRREERIEKLSVIVTLFVIGNTIFFNISETLDGVRNACNVLPNPPSYPPLGLLFHIMGIEKRVDMVPHILAPTGVSLRSRLDRPRLHPEAADMFRHIPSAACPRRELSNKAAERIGLQKQTKYIRHRSQHRLLKHNKEGDQPEHLTYSLHPRIMFVKLDFSEFRVQSNSIPQPPIHRSQACDVARRKKLSDPIQGVVWKSIHHVYHQSACSGVWGRFNIGKVMIDFGVFAEWRGLEEVPARICRAMMSTNGYFERYWWGMNPSKPSSRFKGELKRWRSGEKIAVESVSVSYTKVASTSQNTETLISFKRTRNSREGSADVGYCSM